MSEESENNAVDRKPIQSSGADGARTDIPGADKINSCKELPTDSTVFVAGLAAQHVEEKEPIVRWEESEDGVFNVFAANPDDLDNVAHFLDDRWGLLISSGAGAGGGPGAPGAPGGMGSAPGSAPGASPK